MKFFPTILPSHKKPSSKKNMFQNYFDHLCHLAVVGAKLYEKQVPLNVPGKLDLLIKEVASRFNIFDSLRDGHDYFDEVVGATVIPYLVDAVAIGMAGMAIVETALALAIKARVMKDDGNEHMEKAMNYLLYAVVASVFSMVIFIKSAISLVTRPLATLIRNYKPQDEDRFYQIDVAKRNVEIIDSVKGCFR